ncbi:MAG: RagB/SusD family protein [Pelobium sp.]
MKRKVKSLFKYTVALGSIVLLFSCKKTFDIAPGNALEAGQAYRNVFDADAAVLGIYGQFLGLGKQYIVLNELRADLMDVTVNGDKDLIQINNHTETAGNQYANPLPFYKIIANCNDVLFNFNIMLAENRMTLDEYNQRYSDIGALRSWLYLQVGIHWGNVPYITEPIANIDDLKDATKFKRIPFDELLDKTLAFAESLPYKEAYPAGSSLLNSNDGYSMAKVFIIKKLILGDLNLWKQNWSKAAGYYNAIMNSALQLYPAANSQDYYETYRIAYTGDINNGNWHNIFDQAFNERFSNYDNIWVMPFDKNFSPENPFIKMFSTSKDYLFKPSIKAVNNWANEVSNTNTRVGDSYRAQGSYRDNLGNPEITKFLGRYSAGLPFETTGKWILYRAGQLHLRMAEAANRDNRNLLAMAILNNGFLPNFDDPTDFRSASDKRSRNVTNIQQTAESPSSPYYFDAREGNNPTFRGPYYRGYGIRNRVALAPVVLDSVKYFDLTAKSIVTKNSADVITAIKYKPVTNQAALNLFIEDALIKEAAEETAFEGYRWPDLLRIALRRNDTNYLATKVAAKFPVGSADYAKTLSRLSNRDNWYLPFKWE